MTLPTLGGRGAQPSGPDLGPSQPIRAVDADLRGL